MKGVTRPEMTTLPASALYNLGQSIAFVHHNLHALVAHFAYAPRGPVLGTWDEAALERFTQLARERLKGAGRPSHLRIDPEIERGADRDDEGAGHDALDAAGWRPAPAIQPVSTRSSTSAADEDALWGDLRKKWRQYVNKARSAA